MASNPERSRAAADHAGVPQHLADALDQSAEDLHYGRVEDAHRQHGTVRISGS